MSVYKYTMTKYAKSWSTWIIMVIAFVIVYTIVGPLFFGKVTNKISAIKYESITSIFLGAVISLTLLFASIFTAFKGAQVYRDEVEDGTFLIVLSKPQSRNQIIFYKWLTYMTFNILFLVVVLLAATLGIVIEGRTPVYNISGINISIYHNLWKNIGVLFGLGFVILLIFSSISLIISTKLSAGATIGLVIAIGVSVQITGLIGQFSQTTQYDVGFLQSSVNTRIKSYNNSITKLAKKHNVDTNLKKYKEQIGQLDKVLTMIYTISMAKKGVEIDAGKKAPKKLIGLGLSSIGINNNKTVSFKFLSFIDISYQEYLLGNIADQVSSKKSPNSSIIEPFALASKQQPSAAGIKKQELIKVITDNSMITNITKKIDDFNKLINIELQLIFPKVKKTDPDYKNIFNDHKFDWSWLVNLDILKGTLETLGIKGIIPNGKTINKQIQSVLNGLIKNKKLDEIKYVDFLNQYWVLGIYMAIGVILLPLSYLILRRQDFR